MTRTEAYLALNLLPSIGPLRVRRLLEQFDSPEAILSATTAELVRVPNISQGLAETISTWEQQIDLAGEQKKINDRGLTLLHQEDDLFPPLLREVNDSPFLLYVWGQIEKRDHNAIGVVGSRAATSYGLSSAKKLSFQLAYAGFTVISGLARGIDTAAHEAALAAKGRTIAVIGSGIGQLYPPENLGLAQRIAENGAVVSEYPVDRIADKQTFPYRNRIVAGWSNGLVVVEAPARSGSLITAQQALDRGRTVYAVPGQIDRPSSGGCNRLIQQGAKLIMDGADVLDDQLVLFPDNAPKKPGASPSTAPAGPITLTLEEQILVNTIAEGEAHIDELITRSGLTAATVSSTLMRLEMKRQIRALPGRRYTAVQTGL
ncbi:MAG: DNA-processing protein DprA [Verrucomicrobiales bacterium]|nr:DNA-processing protein DprA [Verrucomicrobiales bacterium]MCP5558548.1 DNA-protecting protein DprA [Verrucomicrobiaceae bacterium]